MPYEYLLTELSREGRPEYPIQDQDLGWNEFAGLPDKYKRKIPLKLPSVSQSDVVRHFTNLSNKNMGIDTNFYPLGSCTMKHNPRVNEAVAALPGFAGVHPLQDPETMQGLLQCYHELEQWLCEASGLNAVSFQPAAGAHGELTALFVIRKYFKDKGDKGRTKVLVPDSAHGTNPASCTFAGYETVSVKSGKDGLVDMEDFKSKVGKDVAAMMITNPNTLGLFEENIAEIANVLHGVGAQLYMDGANFNAIMGYARPGDFGVDVMHFNLHKTFSTPHGGGGPGAGPIGVRSHLEPFLPCPRVRRTEGNDYELYTTPKSIGRVRQFFGNTGMVTRAYTYIGAYGGEGLKAVSENAVLNANYLMSKLKKDYHLPHDRKCMHEFVLSAVKQNETEVHATDIAKCLLDYGFHPMTIYFPLIVPEAMMIEPTETENKNTLDKFAEVMREIADKSKSDPNYVKNAPYKMPVTRLDEVTASRKPVLTWEQKPGE